MGFVSPPIPTGALIPPRAIRCPGNCNSSENRLNLYKGSQVKGTQKNWSLRGGKFPKTIVPHVKELLASIYSDDPAGFWYFHGPNGVGKSYILIAAVNEAIRQQRSAIYTSTTQLLTLLRDATIESNTAEIQLLDRMKSVTVLAIDELGRERSTEYAMEKLFQIFDSRYRSAHNFDAQNPAKLTILGGNLLVNELESYLQSRLQDRNSRVVTMQKLEDRRKRNTALATTQGK